MSIHIVIDPEYSASTWSRNISHGILEQAKQNRIECFFQKDSFTTQSTDLIVLISTSPAWIYETLEKFQTTHAAHIVLISNNPYHLSVNSICTDSSQSMINILSYLEEDCFCSKIAFYGANPYSTADILKKNSFSKPENIYYSNDDLFSCFQTFYNDINKFDAIICANDYAAISLIHNLKKYDPQQINRLFIISFANTHISQEYKPSITSVTLDYYEYGRTTVNLYRMLLKNPQISTATVYIKSMIIPRETTKNIPYHEKPVMSAISASLSNNVFFKDAEIRNLVALETLFTVWDDTDSQIIHFLSTGYSYERISQELFMSVNGIKYRINKLLDLCGLKSRKELIEIYNTYFG